MRSLSPPVTLAPLLAGLLAACDGAGELASPTSPITLAALQVELFGPSCSFGACHGGPNPKHGLDLSSFEASRASLVGVATKAGDGLRVAPGAPEASQLVQVLSGAVGEVRQMPLGFALPSETVDRVRAWVAAGAPSGDPAEVGAPSAPAEQTSAAPEAPTAAEFPPPAPGDGFQMGIDTEAEAGEEIWKCFVADLPTAELSPVNRVSAVQSPGVHHMDVMALGLLDLPIEPGMYDCADLYAAHAEMMEDGLFIFATQNATEELTLPEGTVALIPPALRVMVEIHYVNPLPRKAPVWSRINAFTIPPDAMKAQIWGGAVRTTEIAIPPRTERHYEWVRCEMNRDIDLIILSSHSHQLAELVDVHLWDGTRRGERVYENDDWHAPVLKQFDPPLHIPAGTGFEFRCHYRNPGDEEVRWGFAADDEMCQIGLVHTPFDTEARCEVVDLGRGPTLPE